MPWLQRRHSEAESDFQREQVEGYMREVPCAECGGARLKPESLAVTVGGRNIAELCRAVDRRTAHDLLGTSSSTDARRDDRRAGDEGDPRPPAVPRRRRSRLPDARPLGGHARRRGGPADPARQPDRKRARRRALRARRAVDRAAPAGQPAAHRDARPPAGPRQHRASSSSTTRRRSASPTTSSTSARAPASTAARSSAPARSKDLLDVQGVDHRPVPLGHAGRSPVPAMRREPRADWLVVRGAREHNLQNIDVEFPLGCFVGVTGVSGSGKSTLVNDILHRALMQRIYHVPRPCPGATRRSRAPKPLDKVIDIDQSPDRAHAPLEPGDLHRGLRPHPQAVQPDVGGEAARLPAGPFLLQRLRRPLRGVRGRRHDQDRDALPPRRLRAL